MVAQGYREETSGPKTSEVSKATAAQVKHVGAEGKTHATEIEKLQAQLRQEKEQRAQQEARLAELEKKMASVSLSPPSQTRVCSLNCGSPAAMHCADCKALFCDECFAFEHAGEKANHRARKRNPSVVNPV